MRVRIRSLASVAASIAAGALAAAPVAAHAAPGDILVGNDHGILRVDPVSGDRTLVSGRPARGWDGVAVAHDGTVYAVDRVADQVLARPSGGGPFAIVSGTARGTGPAVVEPADLAIEADGALLLVQDTGVDAMLLRIDPATGDRTLVSGIARGSGSFGFKLPVAVAVEAGGTILVSDDGNPGPPTIFRVHPATGDRAVVSGHVPMSSDEVGAGPALGGLDDLAVGVGGAIYAAASSRVLAIDPGSGDRVLVWTTPVGAQLRAIDAAPSALLVTLAEPPSMLALDPMTGLTTPLSDSERGAGPALDSPTGVAATPSGDAVVAADPGVFDVELATGDRSIPGDELVGDGPVPVSYADFALAPDGALWVADATGGALFEVDLATGDRRRVDGSGPSLADVEHVSVSTAGTVYALLENSFFIRPGFRVAETYAVLEIAAGSGDRTLVSGKVGDEQRGDLVPFPLDLAIPPDGRIWVLRTTSGIFPTRSISELDAELGGVELLVQTTDGIPDGPELGTVLAVASDGALLATGGSGVLDVDTTNGDRTEIASRTFVAFAGEASGAIVGVDEQQRVVRVADASDPGQVVSQDGTIGAGPALATPTAIAVVVPEGSAFASALAAIAALRALAARRRL